MNNGRARKLLKYCESAYPKPLVPSKYRELKEAWKHMTRKERGKLTQVMGS